MDGEMLDRWLQNAAFNAENVRGQVITIPILLDPSLPPDGWYLKADLVECGSE